MAKKLTDKQLAFIEHYLTHWNATKAAIDAGYSEKTARTTGSENLTKPDIQAAIQQRLTELKMGADEVLTRLAKHARADMGDFLRIDEDDVTVTWSLLKLPTDENGEVDELGARMRLAMQENVEPTDRILRTETIKRAWARLDLMEAGRRGKLDLIKEYKIDKDGAVTAKLVDSQAALALIGKHHGLFVEKIDISRQEIEAFLDRLKHNLPPEEYARIVALAAGQGADRE